MWEQTIEGADSTILCNICNLLSNSALLDNEDIKTIFGSFSALLSIHNEKLEYSTLPHVSAALLFYSSPLLLTISDVIFLTKTLYENLSTGRVDASDSNDISDIEEFAQYIRSKITDNPIDETMSIDMAKDIIKDINVKSKDTGFLLGDLTYEDQVFQLIQKRLLLNSIYIDNIDLGKDVLILMEDYEPFITWHSGPYSAYKYYWDNFASITDLPILKYHEFCKTTSPAELFNSLITPLNSSSYSQKVEPTKWMHKVILPVLQWKGSDLQPLRDWMFHNEHINDKFYSQKQNIWLSIINSFLNSDIPFESFKEILEFYIAACYYDFISTSKISSLEMLQCFDLIKETCSTMIPILPSGDSVKLSTEFFLEEKFENLQDFKTNSSLKPYFEATKFNVISLSEMIDTCTQLYPINQLTVPKYLSLKYSKSNIDDSKREISKIINGLKTSNSSQLLNSLRLFKSNFINDEESLRSIDFLVIDRFLFNNLFEIVNTFYDEHNLGITPNQLFELLLKKFWDSVNNSTNFDERVGKLRDASNCVIIFDKLSRDGDLKDENKAEIIRLKHLLKVFANIKNFKLQLDKLKSSTPQDVIKRFGSLPSNQELVTEMESSSPMGLATTILEQNPKSYIAFEKLFKILNDFLLYLDDSNSNPAYYFQRLNGACIEAALIDSNFNYAYKKSTELLEHYEGERSGNLNSMWMTFYQVGNYHSPDWNMDYNKIDSGKVEILLKQSEVLSKYLRVIDRTDVSIDNSRIIVEKWEDVNELIDQWYSQVETMQKANNSKTTSRQLQQNITTTANEILSDAANTTNQASEKLSNLFVSGLGWALGANQTQ